jgi:hypothetical protein
MTSSWLSAAAQQDEGPVLKPKKQPAKPGSSTLLVFCDLACNWNLDGVAKGRIDTGASAREKVGPGQHLVIATTEDGVDQFKQVSELKPSEQTVLTIGLKSLRDARLKAEQEVRAKAASEQKEKEDARLRQVSEQEDRDRIAKEKEFNTATVSSAPQLTRPKPIRKSVVHLLRPYNNAVFSAATTSCDGRPLVKIGHHEYFDFQLEPGNHTLTVQKRISTPELNFPLEVPEGQDLFIVLNWEADGNQARWIVYPTSMQVGKDLVTKLKRVNGHDSANSPLPSEK